MAELNVSNRNLEHLEAIAPNIAIINCSNNLLQELPPIHETVIELNCSTNNIEVLPDLPSTLQILNCSDNPLEELPTIPVSLQRLLCGFTQIQRITLPDTLLNLLFIDCYGCELEELPVLPPNVTEINCGNNSITRLLAPLPTGLISLICDDNELVELPEIPSTVVELVCDHNKILRLPTLPLDIEIVKCSSNRLQELPSLPSSIVQFDVNYNPLTIAYSEIVRHAFPDQEFIPGGSEDFVEPDDYEDPDFTEGDHIQARNIAVQQEVHQAFDKIDITKLIPIIDSEDTPPYHPEGLLVFLTQLVHDNTLNPEEKGRIIMLFERISENIRDTLQSCIIDAATQRLISAVLTYVGRQNPEFQNNYIRFLIDDISSAYEFNPEIPDLQTASCAKGIKERIIMSLKSATLGQSEAYQPLLHAFIHNIPVDIMRDFTSVCLEDARVKELLEAKPEPSSDEKARILASCIREKLRNANYIPQSEGAEEVPDPPEFTAYIAELPAGFRGGKTKKNKNKNKNKKKTRKLKKTKRKIKKNKKKTKKIFH